jgi:hypothetical protein
MMLLALFTPFAALPLLCALERVELWMDDTEHPQDLGRVRRTKPRTARTFDQDVHLARPTARLRGRCR